jgi:hypothetical protein
MMKKTMILICLLVLSIGMRAAGNGEVNGIHVVTNLKDTTGKDITYDFLFSSGPKLVYQTNYTDDGTISSREIAISSKDVKDRFGEDEIILNQNNFEKITFIHVDVTGIRNALSDSNVTVKMAGNHIMEISGLTVGETVNIYSLDGKQFDSVKASSTGDVKVAIPGNETGTVYIVRTGTISFKVRTK